MGSISTKERLAASEIVRRLAHFTGTEAYHGFGWRRGIGIVATDGAKAMAELCGAYWLLDVIASHQSSKVDAACGGFQLWTLRHDPTDNLPHSAMVECRPDIDKEPVVQQRISYTDFPLPDGITLYVEGDSSLQVVLLPSEH